MASLGFFNGEDAWEHQCGATLISQHHFLTAANCAKNINKYYILKQGTTKRFNHKKICKTSSVTMGEGKLLLGWILAKFSGASNLLKSNFLVCESDHGAHWVSSDSPKLWV